MFLTHRMDAAQLIAHLQLPNHPDGQVLRDTVKALECFEDVRAGSPNAGKAPTVPSSWLRASEADVCRLPVKRYLALLVCRVLGVPPERGF